MHAHSASRKEVVNFEAGLASLRDVELFRSLTRLFKVSQSVAGRDSLKCLKGANLPIYIA